MKLYAIRIFVKDWANGAAFYRDTLGLEERFRDDDLGWAEYDVGGPCIGLERVEEGDAEGEALVGRFVGMSLQVDDMDTTCARLSGKGVRFTMPPERQPWGGILAHIADPDGNEITLLAQ